MMIDVDDDRARLRPVDGVEGAPSVAAIGSCRVYNPLRHAVAVGLATGFVNLFFHVHNPLEIRQALRLLKGEKALPPAFLVPWLNVRVTIGGEASAFDRMTAESSVLVIELSSIRLITFDGWELQINTFRDILATLGVPASLTSNLHGTAEEREAARAEILDGFSLPDDARRVVAGAEFREMDALEIAQSVRELRRMTGRPVLFVGTVETKPNGQPIAQRVLLNETVAEVAGLLPKTAFFNPTRLVERDSFEVVMKDLGHYNDAYEKVAGVALMAALGALLARS